MSVLTAGDMLDRAQDFESRLEAFYADLRDRASDDGVRLLTHYLARHRRHLPEALGCVSDVQLAHIRHAPIHYDDTEFDPITLFHGKDLPSDVTGEELLSVAIEFVEALIGFFRWMVLQPLGEEAGTLFQCLLRTEETHVIELKKIKAMHYF